MRKTERVRFEMFMRVAPLIAGNAADFVVGGIVLAQLIVLQAVIASIQVLTGEQVVSLSDSMFGTESKDTIRENLRVILASMAKTARSMAYQFPGITLKFRLMHNEADIDFLSRARAFLAEADSYKEDFLRYEIEPNFMTNLQTLIDSFEQALGERGESVESHVGATANIGEQIRKGMIAVRMMDAPVKNRYKDDVGKLAQWVSARHVRKEPEHSDEGGGTLPNG
jgi:hypothetical protein